MTKHRLDDKALEAAANVFMSFLPNNNRPTSEADRHAAQEIIAAYLTVLHCERPELPHVGSQETLARWFLAERADRLAACHRQPEGEGEPR